MGHFYVYKSKPRAYLQVQPTKSIPIKSARIDTMEGFTYKKDLMAYIRKVLVKLGPTYDLEKTSPEMYTFFCKLFQKHPQWASKRDRLSRVEIVQSGISSKGGTPTYGFMLSYEGNKPSDDISWVKCVNVKQGVASRPAEGAHDVCCSAKEDYKANFYSAMRQAIQSQVKTASMGFDTKTCGNCGVRGRDVCFHVDHKGIGFARLMKSFIDGRIDVPNYDGVVSAPGLLYRHEFSKTHTEFTKAWQMYHARHAKLQIVCAECNLVVLPKLRKQY